MIVSKVSKGFIVGLLLTGLGFSGMVEAAPAKYNLLTFMRESAEGMDWETTPVKMGQMDVGGTLQGLGSGESRAAYKLDGKYDVLEGWIGYLKTAAKGRSCRFEVMADGATIFMSDTISSGGEPLKVRIPIKGKQMVVLGIKPEGYGATLGAAWGDPSLYSGVSPEDLKQPLLVDINGKRSQVDLPGGIFPKELLVPVPTTPGVSEYRVKVSSDAEHNKVEITVEKAKP